MLTIVAGVQIVQIVRVGVQVWKCMGVVLLGGSCVYCVPLNSRILCRIWYSSIAVNVANAMPVKVYITAP